MVKFVLVWHVLEASEHSALEVLEVQVGLAHEEDIEKVSETDGIFESERIKKIMLNNKFNNE